MTDGYTLRTAAVEDAELIRDHRRAMFSDMGYEDQAALDTMGTHFLPWVSDRLRRGEYVAWFAVAEDRSIAAGLGLWLMDWPPHMLGAAPYRGNIVNVYTQPAHRRRGLARQLMQCALTFCTVHQIRTVVLHASPEGRGLYESLGFQPTNEMRLILNG